MVKRKHPERLKKTKKKLTPIKNLKKRAWAVFSLWIRNRDNHTCYTCLNPIPGKGVHAGHYVHRDSLNFSEKNVHAQCVFCNLYKHGNLTRYAEKLITQYGFQVIAELNSLGNEVKKYTRQELEDIISKYG